MRIITLNQIKEILKSVDIIPFIEEGFIAYSNGYAVVPPVGELFFKNPPGDVHIKYGYIKNDHYYVVKIASGFYENPKINLPSSNGLMLLFNQKTGEIQAILLDEGYLTDLRTAAAGAIAEKFLAPNLVTKIGIIGTGIQARLQLHFLKKVIQCRDVIVFGRDRNNLLQYKDDMKNEELKIQITQTLEELTSTCNLIVTTTPASLPILFANKINKGTHITAVGADTRHKQELDENIFGMADVIVADSISQCMERGDISHALRKKIISAENLIELGNVISGACKGRINDDQITIADLTGLAVQDIQITKAVYEATKNN
jgi:ornithine cyclodeaminase